MEKRSRKEALTYNKMRVIAILLVIWGVASNVAVITHLKGPTPNITVVIIVYSFLNSVMGLVVGWIFNSLGKELDNK